MSFSELLEDRSTQVAVASATCVVGGLVVSRTTKSLSESTSSLLLCCASVFGALAFAACRWRALDFQERRVTKTPLRADRAKMAKAPLELEDKGADQRFRMEDAEGEGRGSGGDNSPWAEWSREREGRFTEPFTFVVAADTQIGISNAVFPWLKRVGGECLV